jgi:oxygen-independent coproporphyrinogen-3 oxidase
MILMGMRLSEGISYDRFEKSFSQMIDMPTIQKLKDQNLIELTATHLKATTRGRLVLNYLIDKLVNDSEL